MKKTLIILAAALMLAACGEKEVTPTPQPSVETINHEHDIFYTVAENASLSIIGGGGTNVHLATDEEWDALLDQFCDYARGGEQVVFCATHHGSQPQANGNTKDTPTTITTADRDKLKDWMKEMEKAGKTVIVTYDNNTGSWNGTAYTNLAPRDTQAVPEDYTGELMFIPTPAVQDSTLGGLVWALQVNADSTLVITVEGMMLWFDCETPDGPMELLQGNGATLRGVANTHTDLNGGNFLTLELEMPEDGIIEF